MSEDKKLTATGTVAASPEAIFALLSDPARHTELDGAGMLRGLASGASPVTGVGDAFVMNMEQDGIGSYQMRSEVTDFEPGRVVAWSPAIYPEGSLKEIIGDLDPRGHIYRWELADAAEGGTTVTHTYDWTAVTDPDTLGLYPRVSQEQMEGTITKLSEAVS